MKKTFRDFLTTKFALILLASIGQILPLSLLAQRKNEAQQGTKSPKESEIILVTSKAIGSSILLEAISRNGSTITIEGAEKKTTTHQNEHGNYTLKNQTIKIKGEVEALACFSNDITAIDLSKAHSLLELHCNSNKLKTFSLPKGNHITLLNCAQNELSSLDLSNAKNLEYLSCEKNQLTQLDLSHSPYLKDVDCSKNQLTTLNLSKNPELQNIICFNNKLEGSAFETMVNTLPSRKGKVAGIITALSEEEEAPAGKVSDTATTKASSQNWVVYDGVNNPLRSKAEGQITLKTNKNIGEEITLVIKTYNNATFQVEGATLKEETSTNGQKKYTLTSQTITIKGDIQEFKSYTNKLSSIDVSKMPELFHLDCKENELTTLDVSKNPHLQTLKCSNNKLTSLDISKNTLLQTLHCGNNQLSSLDISHNPQLKSILCEKNNLKEPEIKKLINSLPSSPFSGGGQTITIAPQKDTTNNTCTKDDVEIAKAKGWSVYQESSKEYEGEGEASKMHKITLEIKGEGFAKLLGVFNFQAIPNGAVISVIARPDDYYKLEKITLNGTDITSTKSFTVDKDATIIVSFKQDTYIVKIEKSEGGEVTIKNFTAEQLKAIPFGTELQVEVKPQEGYELATLTANNQDIKEKKSFKVTQETTIKATFKKRTFKVTLTKPTKGGTISIKGKTDSELNSIAYNTVLQVEVKPQENYELESLKANEQEIKSTMKVTITKETTITATFKMVKKPTPPKPEPKKKTFKVTIQNPQNGTIEIIEKNINLSAVEEGTTLTLKATPTEGYELESLKANEQEIKSTMKVTITKETTITATFKMVKKPTPPTPEPKKKTFAVTIEKAENGTIEVIEKVDLKAVEEGTTLTLKATPAKGYELETLTANGKDIKKVMKVEIKEATILKATFKKSTAIEAVDRATIHLYPNPATDFVRVEGTSPHTTIMLYTMEGQRLLSAQSNAEGSLTLDLSAYNEGVYLLLLDGNSYRLVIRR